MSKYFNQKKKKVTIALLFPKDSIGFYNPSSGVTSGGATVQLDIIARELLSFDSIDAVALIPGSATACAGTSLPFRVVEPYRLASRKLKKFIDLFLCILSLRPDYIFQRGLIPESALLGALLRLFGVKYVFMFAHDVESRGMLQNKRKPSAFFNLLLRISHRLVCQNQLQLQNLGAPWRRKALIFRKGIDTAILPDEEKSIDGIWIARCERWKNPEAFLALAQNNPHRHFMMITSPTADREYFEQIAAGAAALGNLTFLRGASHEEVLGWMNKSRALVITSDSEGDWPMTVLECASLEVPVVSLNFDYNGMLSGYKAGFFCSGDALEMNRLFRALVETDEMRRYAGRCAREYVQKFHHTRTNLTELINHL